MYYGCYACLCVLCRLLSAPTKEHLLGIASIGESMCSTRDPTVTPISPGYVSLEGCPLLAVALSVSQHVAIICGKISPGKCHGLTNLCQWLGFFFVVSMKL